MHFIRAVALFALIIIPRDMANAQTSDNQPLSGKISKVSCAIQSLTMCKDEFCNTLFDIDEAAPLVFDFGNKNYVNPAVSPEPKKMQNVEVVHDGEWFQTKFVIEMPHGTANVTFNANKPDNKPRGSLSMSAASRFSYPQNPSLIIIDSMKCQ